MSKFLSITFILFSSLCGYSQDKHKIDSLLRLVQQSNDDSLKTSLYLEVSEEYWSADPAKCKEYANAALIISKRINSHYLISGAYRNLGSANNFTGQMNDALYYDRLCFKEALLSGNKLRIAQGCSNLGRDLTSFSKYDSAIIFFDMGIKMAKEINNTKQLIALYLNKGNTYFYLSEIDSCIKYFQDGLNESLIINDSVRIVQFYNNIANVKLQKGISDSVVINYLMSAILINERKRNYLNLGDCYATLALAWNVRKNNEKTVYYLKKGIEALTLANNETKTVNLFVSLADKFREMNVLDSAAFYADIAIERGERNHFKRGLAAAYSIKGIVLSEKLDYEPAERYLQKAFKEFAAEKDGEGILLSGNYLATVQTKQKKYKEAETVAVTVFRLADTTKNYQAIRTSSLILSEIYHKQGNDTKAYEYLNYYIAAVDTLDNALNARLMEDMATKYETTKKQDSIALQSRTLELNRAEIKSRKLQLYILLPLSVLILFAGVVIFLFYKKANYNKRIIERLKQGVHHDVKNQYQEIMAFLRLAKNHNNQFSLDDASARISSMAKVHELLYNSRDSADLSLQSYLESLCEEIKNTFGHPDIDINISALITLPSNTANKIGLIVNELVVNIFKYAFEPSQKGFIEVTLKKIDQKYLLRVADSGRGIEVNKNATKGFGSTLIEGWVDELDGTYEVKNNNGTQFEITF